jgi:hypothetical protein
LVLNQVVLPIFFDFISTYICSMIDSGYLKEGKINSSNESLMYWSQKLKCSESDLKESMLKIGSSYNSLILYMEMNQLLNSK